MNNNWQNRILQHNATPPEGAWKNIAGMLDEENGFVARLSVYEAAPPATVQKNIFALLDAADNNSAFAEKMYSFETAAPATVWPNIVTTLEKDGAKVIPFKSVAKKLAAVYWRAAAAVAVIAVISVAIWLMNRNNSKIAPGETAGVKSQNQEIANTKQTNGTNTAPLQNIPVTPKQNNTPKNTTVSNPSYVQDNEVTVLAQNPADGKKDKLQTITGETPQDIAAISTTNSYITITGPDGAPLRVSSKFSNLISYLTEKSPDVQENIDIIIKESAKWKATFAVWRDKMINNAVAPSLTNFMDIIELSDVLENKK